MNDPHTSPEKEVSQEQDFKVVGTYEIENLRISGKVIEDAFNAGKTAERQRIREIVEELRKPMYGQNITEQQIAARHAWNDGLEALLIRLSEGESTP